MIKGEEKTIEFFEEIKKNYEKIIIEKEYMEVYLDLGLEMEMVKNNNNYENDIST